MSRQQLQLALGSSLAALHATALGVDMHDTPAAAPGHSGFMVLHDNGVPDGINGYSNATSGVFGSRRTLLDDFVVPGDETWTLGRFEWTSTHLFDLPAGTGGEFLLRTDAGGTPGAPFQVLAVSSYSEVQTGKIWFSGYETISWVDFDPIVLEAGHYWFEGAIVSVENNFWLTASPIQHSECWVNYEDLGGFQSGTEQFDFAADLAWRVFGTRNAPGEWACCLRDGSCVELSLLDCDVQGGLFQGVDVRCELGLCGAPGVCCFFDNTCVEQAELFCTLDGGDYMGIGTVCGATTCNLCGDFTPPILLDLDTFRLNSGVADDLDGDTDIDLAVSGYNDGVFVLINRGDGTFDLSVPYGPQQLDSLAIGDIDDDGDPDLAAVGNDASFAHVLRNAGDGTFTSAGAYAVGLAPAYVGLRDLNGDDAADMVISNAGEGRISVRTNEGNGIFGERTDYDAGLSPRAGDFGDLDGDSDADFAVPSPDLGTVWVFLNNGDGTFAPGALYPVPGTPTSLVVVDLEGDGDLDIALNDAHGGASTAIVLLNAGDGTFGAGGTFGARPGNGAINAGDVDGDGDADLIVSNWTHMDVAVLRNAGDATFGPAQSYAIGLFPRRPLIVDIDGDHHNDVVVVNRKDVKILLNDCPPCDEDLDLSGAVDFGDILAILAAWGNAGGPEDLDGSGVVDFGDLLVVLSAWGRC